MSLSKCGSSNGISIPLGRNTPCSEPRSYNYMATHLQGSASTECGSTDGLVFDFRISSPTDMRISSPDDYRRYN